MCSTGRCSSREVVPAAEGDYERIETSLVGVYELRPAVKPDSRGFFMKTYDHARFKSLGVALDIRVGSPTFGKWAGVTLSAETHNLICIPSGFAHGFLALTDSMQFLCECSDLCDRQDQHGIWCDDPPVDTLWDTDLPLISDRNPRLECT